MKKRFLAVLLVLVCGLLFAGCGNYLDDYSMDKDIKIVSEATDIEYEEFMKDMNETLGKVKVLEAEARMNLSAEIPAISGVSDKDQTTNMDLTMKMVIDSSDENSPKLALEASASGENTEGGEVVESIEMEIGEYIKDGYAYTREYNKSVKTVDGETKEEVEDNKYKEKLKGQTTPDTSLPGGTEIPTDMQAIVDQVNEMIKEIKGTKGAEFGKDKKGNYVFQIVTIDKDGNRVCQNRLVFANGLLVFMGARTDVLGIQLLIEAGINCNKGKVKYPDFSEYKEKVE